MAKKCRFTDCKHDKEVGCAIKDAIKDGNLSMERFKSYKSQLEELKILKEKKKSYNNSRINKFNKMNNK